MTIGPAPMITIDLISVRLGIQFASLEGRWADITEGRGNVKKNVTIHPHQVDFIYPV